MTTPALLRDERGAVVSVWTAVIATTMVLVLGIAVDLSGLVAAAQAARQAGQQLSTGTLLQQGRLEVRTRQARAAAVDYLEAVGMTGTATVQDGTTLVVTAQASYQPLFLSGMGIGEVQVSGTSSVRVLRVEDGTER
jgi:Flp pilus assembly protein TadG